MEVRIVVDNRVVVSRRYVDNGEPVEAQSKSWYPAMEGVFQYIHDALSGGGEIGSAVYHRRLGHPIRVPIDPLPTFADDEVTLLVRDFRAR